MPSTCIFEFDRPEPIYYSGETINGRVVLSTTSDKSVNEIYILFEGEAKVRWEEHKTRTVNGKTSSYTEYYRGKETYLNTRAVVHGDGNLPPGTHSYTICIPLPPECPSSCVEKYGKISYELSLVLDRSWRFNNVFKQPITVLSMLNLNLNPTYLLPLEDEDVKYFCCWPCKSGPVTSKLTIPFGGYAPGQKINYTLEIDNQSQGNDLEGIELKLIQIYTFKAHTPCSKTRTHENKLAEAAQSERVLRLSKRIISGALVIPPVPPTTQQVYIICVNYFIELAIKTGDCHNDAVFKVPITIGTIPLVQSATNPANTNVWIPETPNTPQTPDGNDSPPSYSGFKPPSFEEATTIGEKFIDIDIDEHNRTDDFIPKYPMYTNFAEPSAPPAETPEVTTTTSAETHTYGWNTQT